ncbi:MAG: DUF4190 domain-containing protein [Pirellulaceae bacterium]|nr:DUF4190 domain-containing protein [Pirellulaceae bacterium]
MSDTNTQRPELRLGEGEAPLETYRSMSGLAIATLVLGLVSFLALFFSIFWLIPLAAMACGILAVRQIATHPDQLAGRRLALAGISLALLFLAWGVTQAKLRRLVLVGHARPYVDDWLNRVREGRLQEAHQMFLEPGERQPPATDLAHFYAEQPEATRRLKAMFDQMPQKALVAHGADGKLSFDKVESIYRDDGYDYVVLRYRFQYTENGQPREVRPRIVLRRMLNPHDNVAVWKFQDLSQVAEP